MTCSTGDGMGPRHPRALLAVVLIGLLAVSLLAGIWLVTGPGARATPESLPSATAVLPTGTAIPTPSPRWTPILRATPTSISAGTPTPAILHPTITNVDAQVDDKARTLTFRLAALVPPGRHISEVVLWYDTEVGHLLRRTPGPLPSSVTLSYVLDAAQEGLTQTLTTTGELDYWWLVRDSAGESARAGGTAALGPALQALVTVATPVSPVGFTWAVSDTGHFRFRYPPDSAAERDRFQIGTKAEAALKEVSAALSMDLHDQMQVYLVPRVFWQGAATYAKKTLLISYLDRNYTGVDIASYFSHETTHALAQDLLRPQEGEGGPDGVLVEGLAVWAGGGHYGPEPIDDWAAVVAASSDFIPLAKLRAGPFYDFQHETSYLEAGSFVGFLAKRYGLDRLKALYGKASGNAARDEVLVQQLYGIDYAGLEEEWLAYLKTLSPTSEQAERWYLQMRSFDLMRLYETKWDPTARILPDKAPPEWTSDTLKLFLAPVEKPANVALETALIAAQERMHEGDLEGAAVLLDDVAAALGESGPWGRPGLVARRQILELVSTQSRAVLRADVGAYLGTFERGYALGIAADRLLQFPFIAYEQEIVRLDVVGDEGRALGVVVVHGRLLDGRYDEDGRKSPITLAEIGHQWLMSGTASTEPVSWPISGP